MFLKQRGGIFAIKDLIEFIENPDIKDIQIKQGGYYHLNKLKKSNQAEFYYCHQYIQIMYG